MPITQSGYINIGALSREAGNVNANGGVDTSVPYTLSDADQDLTYKPNSDGSNPIDISEFYDAARTVIQGYYFVSGSSPASSSTDICDFAFNSSPLTTFSIGVGSFRSTYSELRAQPAFTDEMPQDGDYVYVYIGPGQNGEGGTDGFWQEYTYDALNNKLICTNTYQNYTCLVKPNGSTGGGLPSNPTVPPHSFNIFRSLPQSTSGLCNAQGELIWSNESTLALATIIYRREPDGSGGYTYPLAYAGWYSQDGTNARKWNGSAFVANDTYSCE